MGFILQQGCTILCPHGGSVSVVTTNTKVKVGGGYALLATDTFTVSGCPFTVGQKYQPCVTVQWQNPAQKVKVNGTPVLLNSSTGLCQSAEQIPQGSANVVSFQTKVQAQ